MTRWARAKNALQQQKQPEDSTPWRTFIKERKELLKFEGSRKSNKIKQLPNVSQQQELEKEVIKPKKFKENEKQELPNAVETTDLKKNGKRAKLAKKKKVKTCNLNETSISFNNSEQLKSDIKQESNSNILNNTSAINSHIKKKKAKLKKPNVSPPNKYTSSNIQESEDSFKEAKNLHNKKEISNKTNLKFKKKTLMRAKLMKKRTQQGLILLPENVENNIYNVKKSLRKKGIPEEDIKRIIRRKRRKEELKFRKSIKNEVCFKCRQIGHRMSECPLIQKDNAQGTDICFKCGSTEHISRDCHLKISAFPYATCFICNQQGHLSRQCSQNKNGIYPQGGSCRECGSVQHFKKDCPQLQKLKETPQATAHVMDMKASADADIPDTLEKSIRIAVPKVVKF